MADKQAPQHSTGNTAVDGALDRISARLTAIEMRLNKPAKSNDKGGDEDDSKKTDGKTK